MHVNELNTFNTDRFTKQRKKQMKTITKFVYATFAALELASFALGPSAEAVLPAPDGGYPGGNTAEGSSALLNQIGRAHV